MNAVNLPRRRPRSPDPSDSGRHLKNSGETFHEDGERVRGFSSSHRDARGRERERRNGPRESWESRRYGERESGYESPTNEHLGYVRDYSPEPRGASLPDDGRWDTGRGRTDDYDVGRRSRSRYRDESPRRRDYEGYAYEGRHRDTYGDERRERGARYRNDEAYIQRPEREPRWGDSYRHGSSRRRSPSPIWGRSPTPPQSLEDRLTVGLSRKRRQELREGKTRRKRRSTSVDKACMAGSNSAERIYSAVEGRQSPSRSRHGNSESQGESDRGQHYMDRTGEAERDLKDALQVNENTDDAGNGEKKDGPVEGAREVEEKPGGTELVAGGDDDDDDDDDDEVDGLGPSLPSAASAPSRGVDYGKALLPGEANAMAAFIQDGKRIPRRGEIGLSSDQIAKFEEQGYVMSGSRNRRMEAVRIRKENQVYTAEELAALSQYNHEEKQAREKRILNEFRAYVASKLGEDALPAVGAQGGTTKPDTSANFGAKP